jgi:hypothetical protein
MSININKIAYDSTTPADGAALAAFVRTSAGALTSTNIGGKEGLDVNVINDIAVEIDGVYDAGDNLTPDNVGLVGHVRDAAPGAEEQTLRLTGGNPSGDDLDPANIFALDTTSFLHAWDGSAWDRVGLTSGALNVMPQGNVADDAADAGNPIKMGARSIDAALTELSAADDRSDLIVDSYRRLLVSTAPNVEGSVAAVSVTTTAATLGAATSGRKRVVIENRGAKAIAIGFADTVTFASGLVIDAKASWSEEVGEFVPLFAISESGTQDVRFMQLA